MQWDFRERARATKDFLKCLDEGDNQIIISDNDSGYYVGCLIKIAQDYGYTRQYSGMVVDATLYKFVPGEFNRFLEANGSYNRRPSLEHAVLFDSNIESCKYDVVERLNAKFDEKMFLHPYPNGKVNVSAMWMYPELVHNNTFVSNTFNNAVFARVAAEVGCELVHDDHFGPVFVFDFGC